MSEINLTAKTCTPCQGGVPPMTAAVAKGLILSVPGWSLLEEATKLKRTYEFSNFVKALAFVNQVADLCEVEGHHADITFGWGYAKIIFQTHKINGLHENDFIMAAKVNVLLA